MRQSRRASLIEATLNTVIGYFIAVAAQIVVFPLFGIHVSLVTDLVIGLIFMIISMLRSYYLRRLFEWLRVSGGLP